jgi:glc operon protein GlcG
MLRFARTLSMAVALIALSAAVQPGNAQQQRAPEAPRISLEDAKKAMDGAEAEAKKNGWTLAFVISDAEGTPVYVRRMDGAPKFYYDIAVRKVNTAIKSGMHTLDYAAAVRGGLAPIEGGIAFEGGLLLKRDGKVLGAFSASGARPNEDGQAVKAGMTAIGIQP